MFSKEMQFTPTSLTPQPGLLETTRPGLKLPFAFLGGALLGLSTPGFDQAFLAWLGLVPLLVLLRGARNTFEAVCTGFTFGFGYYAVALSFFAGLNPLRWMQIPDILGYQLIFLSWLLEAAHQALLIALFSFFVYHLPVRPGFLPHFRRPYYPYILTLPVIWVFIMWVVSPSPIFMSIPICQLAYSQARNLDLIQIAALGGSAAVDFLLVMVNCAIASIIIETTPLVKKLSERADQLNPKAGMISDLAISMLVIAAVSGWGEYRLMALNEAQKPEKAIKQNPESPPVPVAIVQGNVSIEEERFKTISKEEFKSRYQELSTALGAALLVLPEGVVTAEQDQAGLRDALKKIVQSEKKEIIYGTVEPLKEGYANQAKIISPYNLKNDSYIKQKLVPFGESIPINLVYQRIPEELREKIPASKERFIEDKSARLLNSGYGKVGIAICNEIVYPSLVSDEVRKGASLIVCLANLGWFHNSSLGKQFLACATFRAVENKRYLILCTNTGISSVIAPTGVLLSKSYGLKRGILLDTVQFIYSKTPFCRMRWL